MYTKSKSESEGQPPCLLWHFASSCLNSGFDSEYPKGQFEGRGTRLLYLDDESYASDEAKPLPE